MVCSAPNGIGTSEQWQRVTGMKVTDGAKEPEITQKGITEVVFLKRNFKWDPELGAYLALLSKKSMSRTLLVKKDTQMSTLDHLANSISEVLRELVYYGREDYEKAYSALQLIASQYGVTDNAYYRVKTYDARRAEVMTRQYSAWETWQPLSADISANPILQGITEFSTVKAGLDTANNAEEVSSATHLTHAVGAIDSESAHVSDALHGPLTFLQNFPETNLGNFLERYTPIS